MKRYRFRLETVLRVRRIQEEQARARLLHANTEVRAAEARIVDRVEHYRELPPADGGAGRAAFDLARFRLDQAVGAIGVARADHHHAVEVAAHRRHEWSEAATRVASLERLDERHRDLHAIDVRRDEDRTVDDLVVAAHARRAPTSSHPDPEPR